MKIFTAPSRAENNSGFKSKTFHSRSRNVPEKGKDIADHGNVGLAASHPTRPATNNRRTDSASRTGFNLSAWPGAAPPQVTAILTILQQQKLSSPLLQLHLYPWIPHVSASLPAAGLCNPQTFQSHEPICGLSLVFVGLFLSLATPSI